MPVPSFKRFGTARFDKFKSASQTVTMLRFMLTTAIISFSSPAFAGEDCTCKYKDYDVPEGQTICMQTPNGSKMATCSRVLNNTSWKFLEQACPQAHNTINQSPALLNHADLKKLTNQQKG